ncbi:hypothetical protein KFL01_28120 [Kocuria flava]|nr:hypothetical protein KFL01_28120 [Kocuria flava]
MQIRFADDPCLTAAREQLLVHAGDIRTDRRWPPYATAAAYDGIRSVLAVPFDLAGVGPACLNTHCDRPHAFDSAQIQAVQQMVAATSRTLREASLLLRRRDREAELAAATASRTTVERAVGIVMGQYGCPQEEAFRLLRTASHRRGIKLRELVAELVAAHPADH